MFELEKLSDYKLSVFGVTRRARECRLGMIQTLVFFIFNLFLLSIFFFPKE